MKNGPALKILAEPGKDTFYPLTRRLTTIGSGKKNHIVLSHASVKEDQACILFKTGQYQIKNLCSPQNLKINGKPVKNTAILSPGDKIEIGKVELEFTDESFSSAEEKNNGDLRDVLDHVERDEVLRLFSSVVQAISSLISESDQKQTAVKLVEVIARLMHCDGVRLLMKQQGKDELETVAVYPTRASNERFSRTALQWANERGYTVLVSDIEDEDSLTPEESMIIKEICSILCAPLGTEKDNFIGYLYLDRLKGHSPFNQRDEALFEKLRELFSKLLTNVIQKQRQAESIRILQENAVNSGKETMIFQSNSIQQLVEQAATAARSDIPILIQGETGTGKEIFARFIHRTSSRSSGPFVAINCGAIPENLMESEFFGHEKGAFTGAATAKKGHMESANEGTLFLDEISELPVGLQVKMLRALQEKEIVPVGSSKPVSINIRIVTATNKDLENEVKSGQFRQDLFFRLNVMSFNIPPLRERDRDVILLAHHFLKQFSAQYGLSPKTLSSSAEKALLEYPWPGNVRELENRIQKAMILSQENVIRPEHLDLQIKNGADESLETIEKARRHAEQMVIHKALKKTGGNISLASKLLDMDRTVLTRLLSKLEIDPVNYKK